MRENLLDRQDFLSHQVCLYSNGNSLAMLILSSQVSLKIVPQFAEYTFQLKILKKGGDAQSSIISIMTRTSAGSRRDDGALGE